MNFTKAFIANQHLSITTESLDGANFEASLSWFLTVSFAG